MTVLITGGTGFIGINIAEELTSVGIDVVLFDKNELPKEAKQSLEKRKGEYHFFHGDVLDSDKLDEVIDKFNISQIIHAAVITPGIEREKKQSKLIAKVNYLGTVEVLEAVKRHNIKKLVYLSSASVYGLASKDEKWLSEESTIPKPKELYAITKFAAEQTALRYKELFSLNIVVGRIGGVFGPWERYTGFRDTMSEQFLTTRAAVLGEKIQLSNVGFKDWVYSREIGKSVLALLRSNKYSYEIYHLSSGYIWTLKEWCEKLSKIFPKFEYEILADPGEIERSPLLIDRLKEDIGYAPKFNLEESFNDYINWVKTTSDFWLYE
jgi:nucleoside-diphosphate-sugar epimerase